MIFVGIVMLGWGIFGDEGVKTGGIQLARNDDGSSRGPSVRPAGPAVLYYAVGVILFGGLALAGVF